MATPRSDVSNDDNGATIVYYKSIEPSSLVARVITANDKDLIVAVTDDGLLVVRQESFDAAVLALASGVQQISGTNLKAPPRRVNAVIVPTGENNK